MRRLLIIAIFMAFLGAGCAKTESKPGKWSLNTHNWSATVVSVDTKTRFATLKDQSGNILTFRVRDEVKGLENVKPGDIVDVDSIEAYAIYVRKATDEPAVNYVEDVEFGSKDGLPTKTTVASIEATGLILAIDYNTHVIVLQSPDGKTIAITVPDTVRNFKQIKVGDEVVTRYTQNTVYSVRKK